MMSPKVEWKFSREPLRKRFISFMVIVITKEQFGNDFVRIKKYSNDYLAWKNHNGYDWIMNILEYNYHVKNDSP